jgi:hypothetical protein
MRGRGSKIMDLYGIKKKKKYIKFIQFNRPISEYNLLTDPGLQSYFTKPSVQKHLRKNGFVNKAFFCSFTYKL